MVTVKDANLCHDWSGGASVLQVTALKIWAKSWIQKGGAARKDMERQDKGETALKYQRAGLGEY